MSVEEDQDQGFSRISDGCASCRTNEVEIRAGVEWRKPVQLVKRERGGRECWVCPKCGGNYGEVK